jgi:hypothetical protein
MDEVLIGTRKLITVVDVHTDERGIWQVPGESRWVRKDAATRTSPSFMDVFCVRADGYARSGYDPWLIESTQPDGSVAELIRGEHREPAGDSPRSKCGSPL